MDTIGWKIGKTRDDKEVRWVPIITVDFGYKKVIGLTTDNFWVTTFEPPMTTDLFLVSDRQGCYHIMAILEKERAEIERKLKLGIEELELPISIYASFPFLDLIKFTLSADGGHWGFKAAKWLRQEEIDDELTAIINDLIVRKSMDKKTRDELFTMMKRYERLKASR